MTRALAWLIRRGPFRLVRFFICYLSAFRREAQRAMARAIEPYSQEELSALFRHFFGQYHLEGCREPVISCPALLLCGEKDRMSRDLKSAKSLSERRGYPLRLIRNGGHNLPTDCPGELNSLIEGFLQGL